MHRSHRPISPALALVAVLFVPCVGGAQTPAPLGPAFRVNGGTGFNLTPGGVAADATGNFMVLWTENAEDGMPSTDGDGPGVLARAFAPDGTPTSGDIVVNTNVQGNQFGIAISADHFGQFVPNWLDCVFSCGDVFVRRFDSRAQALSGAIQADEVSNESRQFGGDLAHDAQGRFFVVWQNGDTFEPGRGIRGRRFDAAGAPLGPAILVSEDNSRPNIRAPRIACDHDGYCVVVWRTAEEQVVPPVSDIHARWFDPNGNPLRPETRLNAIPGEGTGGEVVADAGGRFLVSESGRARVFDRSGNVIAEFPSPGRPLASDAAGNVLFLLAGTSNRAGRIVSMSGAPRGGDFEISPAPAGGQESAAFDASGRFVVIWRGEDSSIMARRFRSLGRSAPVDFGGNGDADVAVFRPSQGRWLADFDFQPAPELNVVYGRSGDVPVPKDYDGDGITDFAVFRDASATWWLDTNRNGGTDRSIVYGRTGDVPVPGDYDGDGRADLAVWRPASGTWFVDVNANGGTDIHAVFGQSGSIPVPGDYDGGGITDFAVFHQGAWRIDTDRDGVSDLTVVYGRAGDVPMPGDYDGDGRTDFALFRPASATWFIDTNRNGGTDLRIVYGQGTDVPVAGDFDGNGSWDLAVYRPASGRWFVDTNRNGGTDLSVFFGTSGDIPLREGGWILDRLGVTP